MLFFHLPYRKLTSNIENSNKSFEKQKSPPVIFPPLILLPIPTPYSIQILSKIKKQSTSKQKSLYSKVDTTKLQTKSEFLIKKSKLFFSSNTFFLARVCESSYFLLFLLTK